MLNASFFSGLSGLRVSSTALNVTGNNLSNINTHGYKRAHSDFAAVFSSFVDGMAGNGNPVQKGFGARTSGIVRRFSQGALASTGIKTHLGIQGNGFFVVGKDSDRFFTRAGNFVLNQEGYFTAPSGALLLGYRADNSGVIDLDAGLEPLRVDLGRTGQPISTTLFRMVTNLSADAPAGDTYQTAMEIVDSLGSTHTLALQFQKGANPGEWSYQFTMDDGSFAPAGFPASGVMQFDGNGNLLAVGPSGGPFVFLSDPGSADLTLNVTGLSNGAADLNMTWDLENDDSTIPGTSYISQYGTESSTGSLSQNGRLSGILQDIVVQQDGVIKGFFDNGSSMALGQVVLAAFSNNHGLKQLDENLFAATQASGSASIGGVGGILPGSIMASTLEASNVDIAEEFTQMILQQRGYQSSSRVLTTVDQLYTEVLNLKR